MTENKAFFEKREAGGETDYGRGKSSGIQVSAGIRVRDKGKAVLHFHPSFLLD